jgi:hypothetical protein
MALAPLPSALDRLRSLAPGPGIRDVIPDLLELNAGVVSVHDAENGHRLGSVSLLGMIDCVIKAGDRSLGAGGFIYGSVHIAEIGSGQQTLPTLRLA